MTELMSLVGALSDKTWWVWVVVLVILGIYAWLILIRTRCCYVLMDCIWRIFAKKDETGGSPISLFLDERRELMRFRFVIGLPVRTTKQMRSVIDWSHLHDEDIGDVARIGDYFDIEKMEIKSKLPGRCGMVLRAIAFSVAMLLATLAVSWVSMNSAFLNVKTSGTVFLVSDGQSRPLRNLLGWNKADILTRELCQNGGNATVFSVKDTKVVCQLLVDKEVVSYTEKAIKSQRIQLLPLLLLILCMTVAIWRWFWKAATAIDMRKRLAKGETSTDIQGRGESEFQLVSR